MYTTARIWIHCKLYIKNPLRHSLKMALGKKPKHVAVMMFWISFKHIVYVIKVAFDSQVICSLYRSKFEKHKSQDTRDLRFEQLYCGGMWPSANWCTVPDVSKGRSAFIFRVKWSRMEHNIQQHSSILKIK